MRGKKGDIINELLFIAFQLMVVAVIFVGLIGWVNRVVSDDEFERNFMARDIALLLDSIHASPGNVEFDYPMDTMQMDFFFRPNMVSISHPEEIAGIASAMYPFAEDKSFPFRHAKVGPEISEKGEVGPSVNLMFAKINNKISVSDKPITTASTASQLVCLSLRTANPLWKTNKKIIFDAGHGVGSGINREADFARIVGLELQNDIPALRSTKGSLFASEDISLERRIDASKSSDMIISVHQNDGLSGTNPLIIYITPLSVESQKLGCLIGNHILEELPETFTKIELIPLNEIPPGDPKQLIDTSIPSVMLEIGNANLKVLPDEKAVASGIYLGIAAYFGESA